MTAKSPNIYSCWSTHTTAVLSCGFVLDVHYCVLFRGAATQIWPASPHSWGCRIAHN